MTAYSLRHASLAYRPSQPKHYFPGFVFKPAITEGTEGLVNPGERLHAQQGRTASSVAPCPASLGGFKDQEVTDTSGVPLFPGVSWKPLGLRCLPQLGEEGEKFAWGHQSTRCKQASWNATLPPSSFTLNWWSSEGLWWRVPYCESGAGFCQEETISRGWMQTLCSHLGPTHVAGMGRKVG